MDANSEVQRLIRADLRGNEPYGAPQLSVKARLNVNENPYPPSQAMVKAVSEAVARATGNLNRYPDRDAVELREALADYVRADSAVPLSHQNIWAANGSNEVMLEIMQCFGGPGKKALTFTPTYSMYPDYCRDTFTELIAVPRRDDFTVDINLIRHAVEEHNPDVVLLASPNNPTGTALELSVIEDLYSFFTGLVVVDEAYAEFRRPGTASALSLLEARPRLVVIRTMSKAFALAGARLGYAIGDPAVISALQLVRLPYHLSVVSQEVARTALTFAPELLAQVESMRRERDELLEWLTSRGLRVADSDANFVLFGIFDDAHLVWQSLLNEGVLIRETGPKGWLRVSIGTPEEMAFFKKALVKIQEKL